MNDRNTSDYLKSFEVPPKEDVLNKLGIDPLKEYKNVDMLAHFVNTMGFIKPRKQTGLTVENQRKVAKAIRRARAIGNY